MIAQNRHRFHQRNNKIPDNASTIDYRVRYRQLPFERFAKFYAARLKATISTALCKQNDEIIARMRTNRSQCPRT